MKTKITIQDISSNRLEDITEDTLLCAISGGEGPSKETSFAYDVGWLVGTAIRTQYLIAKEVISEIASLIE